MCRRLGQLHIVSEIIHDTKVHLHVPYIASVPVSLNCPISHEKSGLITLSTFYWKYADRDKKKRLETQDIILSQVAKPESW